MGDVAHVGKAAGGTRLRLNGRVLRLPGAGRRAYGLGRAALCLDADATRKVLTESVDAIGVQATWDDVARPVLSAVAQHWAATGAGIEIEHLLSECVLRVFEAVATPLPLPANSPPGRGGVVLLAGMPGEHHTLPMAVLAATLAQRGVTCRSLGPDLPVAALVAAIRRTGPAGVVLWSQLSSTADAAVLRTVPRTRQRVRVFAAGPGWSGVELPRSVIWLTSLTHATDLINADMASAAGSSVARSV